MRSYDVSVKNQKISSNPLFFLNVVSNSTLDTDITIITIRIRAQLQRNTVEKCDTKSGQIHFHFGS